MNSAGPVIHHRSFDTNVVLMEHFFFFFLSACPFAGLHVCERSILSFSIRYT